MMPRSKRCRRLRPAASIQRWTGRQARSPPGFSEQRSIAWACCSIRASRSGDRGWRRTEPSRGELLGDDQFPFAGAASIARRYPILVAVTPVGRHQPAALAGILEGPDDSLTGAVEPADDTRFDVAGFERDEPRRSALADL